MPLQQRDQTLGTGGNGFDRGLCVSVENTHSAQVLLAVTPSKDIDLAVSVERNRVTCSLLRSATGELGLFAS